MTVFELMAKLGAARIKLWVEEDQLKFKAPKGALTTELRDQLVGQKQAVIDFLKATQIGNQDDAQIPVADRQQSIPLSYSQQRMWFIEQLMPANSTFHIPATLFLTGLLDRDALRKAFEDLVERHEALRTVFAAQGEQTWQVIKPAGVFRMPVTDLTELPAAERELKARELAEADIRTGFNLQEGPLLRAHLMKLDDNRHALVVVMHHIVSDGWSMDIFVREMSELYAAHRQGRAASLPELSIQYADFAAWQRGWLKGELLDVQLGYWKKQLANAPELLVLPYDHPRPPLKTNHGANLPLHIEGNVLTSLRALARQLDATLYMVLLAAYKVVLAKWSGQGDISVGMPVAGRTLGQVEPLIGFFVNTLVVRTRQDENPTLADFIAQVREQVLGAQAHQDVPLEAVVEALNVPRNLAFSPLYQVAFSMTSSRDQGSTRLVGGLEIEAMPVDLVAARQDITLMLIDKEGELSGMLEYNTDLFTAETMAAFASHFQAVLNQLVADVTLPVAAFELADTQQLQALLSLNEHSEAVLPLTAMQRDFVLDSLRDPATRRNTVGYVTELPFVVDAERWQAALQQVASEQPNQRISFVEATKPWLEPVYQVINEAAQVTLTSVDLSDSDCATDPAKLDVWLRETLLVSWDVLAGSLQKHWLVKLSDARYLALSTWHHGITDGSSEFVRVQQVLAAYQGRATQAQSVAEYASAVRERRRLDDTQALLRFWHQQTDAIEALGYRSKTPGELRVASEALEGARLAALNEWCASRKVSTAALLRALFALAVRRCHYQADDVALIEAVAARNAEQRERTGCYFQFIPAVFKGTDLSADASLGDVLNAHRQWRKQLHDNIFLSFSGRARALNPNALEFQFNYRPPEASQGFSAGEHHCYLSAVQPDNPGMVKLLIAPEAERTELRLSYYEGEFAGYQLLTRMQQVIDQLLAGREQLGELEWLLDSERDQQLCAWQGSMQSLPAPTLMHLVDQQCEATPDALAVLAGSEQLTYQQLSELSQAVAQQLRARGVQAGDRVALCIDKGVALPALVLAVLRLGAAYVPTDPAYPAERLSYIFADSGAKLLIAEQCVLDRFQGDHALPDALATVERAALLADAATVTPEPIANQAQADAPIYVIYTSGSTGKPKGAELYHRGEVNLLEWYADALSLQSDDRFLLISALGFDLTQKNLFAPFIRGAALVMPDDQDYDPTRLAAQIHTQHISVINCAPSAFYPIAALHEHPGYPFASLRALVLGGEPIRQDALRDWLQHADGNCTLFNSYGPTECTDVVAAEAFPAHQPLPATLPIGRPLPNTQLYVVNPDNKLMPTGAVGELCVAGIGVGAGYVGQPEMTAAAFQANPFADGMWYRTGDLVRYGADGELIYVGRKDFQVKLRGLRIEPGEIDTLLREQTGVEDALTLVRDDRLVSYLVASRTLDTSAIRQQLQSRFPAFMVPSALVVLSTWPLTPNGKVDRNALPEPGFEDEGEAFVAPRNDSEQIIADIWCQVLKRDKVSIHADFFGLGGHSLLATQVVARIRQAFGIEMSVRALFEHPTIATLIDVINHAAASGQIITAPPIKPLDEPNRSVLSFAQHRLWFIDQLNQGSAEYNMPAAMRISGPLQPDVLEQALQEIVARHEVLRTNFGVEDGLPTLIVHEPGGWQLTRQDVSQLAASEREAEVARLVDADANRVFNLASDALFTANLIKAGEQDHVLLLNMHHIVSDGWSIGVLVREIKALYEAFAAKQPSPLEPLPVQYSDFAVWQREWLQGRALENLQNYWLKTLGDAPHVLRLPTDRPRPKVQTFNGAHFPVSLGEGLTQKINTFCEQHELTPFMVLMGAYQLLLSRYCQQPDVCVGIPIAGRNRAEIEGLIGFFINGLVIRTKLDGNPRVLDYLARVKEAALGAYAHQDMPADLLADAMKLDRSAEHAPGAQVGFALQNTPQEAVGTQVADLTLTPVLREHKTAKYEFSLILQENAQNLGGVVEFNTDLFDAGTIERMMRHYGRILEQMVADPANCLDNIDLVADQELYELLKVDPAHYELKKVSPMQRDMYLDTLMEPDSLKNSMGYHTIVRGRFDVKEWQAGAQRMVDEQWLLRCTIIGSDLPYTDVAYHRVDKQRTIDVEYVDISDRVISDEEAGDIAQDFIWQPYDITQDLLSQYRVYKLNDDRHLLTFRMNHLVADGVSMVLHGVQNIQVMEALVEGRNPPSVPPLFDMQIAESRKQFDTPEVLAYWKERAQTLEALDFSIPPYCIDPDATPARVEKRLRVADQHWADVQAYCKTVGIHPSLYFKAIYVLLVNLYCRGEDDFYISEVLSGRRGFHKMTFGNYFQIMPLVFPQALFADNRDVKDLFAHIKDYKKQVRDNSNISLLAQRNLLPQGRFAFLFNYYNFIPEVVLFGQKLKVKGYPQVQNGPIQFVCHEQDGYMELVLIYMSNLFADLRFLERFEQLSQQIIAGAKTTDELVYVLPDERQKQLQDWRGPEAPLPEVRSVVDLIEAQTLRSPDAVAVQCGDDQLSYRLLSERSNQLARYLTDQGVVSGDRVAVCLDRSVDMLVSVLGVMKAGAAYVPMDANYPSERLLYMVQDAQARLLITHQCIRERLIDESAAVADVPCLVLDGEGGDAYRQLSGTLPETLPSGDDLIYVIYTSGSTGQPKGAGVYHRGELNLLGWYLDELQLSAEDRFLLVSAFGFDLTQKNLFAVLTQGGRLVIPAMDQFDVDVLGDTLAREAITVVNCAPSAFYPLVEDSSRRGYPYASLRHLVLGGEPIRLTALQGWLDLPEIQCTLINSYGPTECTDVVACHRVAYEEHPPVIPIGRAVQNTQLYVVDQRDKLVPEGIVGELCVSGTGLGAGYLGRDDLTAAVFQANPYTDSRWYRTGDLVRYWPNGDIEYVGRKDFQIKLRGLRIELGEIEAALAKQPGVLDSLTLVHQDKLISYVIADPEFQESAARNALRSSVPEYMVPAQIIALEQWPLTPNGKVDRKALPSPDQKVGVPYVAPRNDTEQRLAQIWSEVLGVEKVGVNDNFFDLGGHSLLAARVVSKFRNEFEVEVPLRSLFELHTIADIAQYLETLKWAAESASQPVEESDTPRDEGFL